MKNRNAQQQRQDAKPFKRGNSSSQLNQQATTATTFFSKPGPLRNRIISHQPDLDAIEARMSNSRPNSIAGGLRQVGNIHSQSNANHRRMVEESNGKYELVYGKTKLLPEFAPKAPAQSQHGTRLKHGRVHQKNVLGKQDQVSIRGGDSYVSVNNINPSAFYKRAGKTAGAFLKSESNWNSLKPPLPLPLPKHHIAISEME